MMKGAEASAAAAGPPSSSSSSPSLSSSKMITKVKINEILSKINRWQDIHTKFESNIPFVCVTYAQTLDGMIAVLHRHQSNDSDDCGGGGGDVNSKGEQKDKGKDKGKKTSPAKPKLSSNLELSCEESFQLTHALRSIHDGILIGGNTLLSDNPRLNNRLWSSLSSSPSSSSSSGRGSGADSNPDLDLDADSDAANSYSKSNHYTQPIPVIMDTNLNSVIKMIKSKTPIRSVSSHDKIIICCSEDAYKTYNEEIQSTYTCNTIHLCPCKLNEQSIEFDIDIDVEKKKGSGGNDNDSGKDELVLLKGGGLNLQNVLNNLRREHGIKSLMVEGGSSVLSSFMSEAESIVNCVCVTTVPKMIGGQNGLLAMGGCNLLRQHLNQEEDENADADGNINMNGNALKGLEFDSSSISWSTIGSDCIFLASSVYR